LINAMAQFAPADAMMTTGQVHAQVPRYQDLYTSTL
jgi:hypothetical protein